MNKPKRRFHSLLLCVEAKVKGDLESAYGQLVVYPANRASTEQKVTFLSMALRQMVSNMSL